MILSFRFAPVLAFLAIAQVSQAANAEGDGPFGFEMGSDVRSYSCSYLRGGKHLCEAPKRHSDFDTYIVQASPEHGICWIKATGIEITDNGYGSSLKARTDAIAGQIRTVYGTPKSLLNTLLPGSIWKDPDDWMMALAQNERYYMHEWSGISSRGINTIYVAAKAKYSQSGYVIVEFYGDNHEACEAAQADEDSSAF